MSEVESEEVKERFNTLYLKQYRKWKEMKQCADLRRELEESVEKCRSLQMETHQFKEQFKSKNSEMEEVAAVQRRKEMAMELTTQKTPKEVGGNIAVSNLQK